MSDDGEDNITSPEQRASGRARLSPWERLGVVPEEGYHAPGRFAFIVVMSLVWRRRRHANPAWAGDFRAGR
jgi:hypothetical protein